MDRAARSWWGLHVAWPVTALSHQPPLVLNLPHGPPHGPAHRPTTQLQKGALLSSVLAAGHAICAAGPLFL